MVKLKRLYFGVFQLLMVRKTIILIRPLTKNSRTWHRNQCNNFQLSKRTHPPMQRPKISLFIALNQAIPHNKLWLYSNLPQFDIYQKICHILSCFQTTRSYYGGDKWQQIVKYGFVSSQIRRYKSYITYIKDHCDLGVSVTQWSTNVSTWWFHMGTMRHIILKK